MTAMSLGTRCDMTSIEQSIAWMALDTFSS